MKTAQQWAAETTDLMVYEYGGYEIDRINLASLIEEVQKDAIQTEREACARLCDERGVPAPSGHLGTHIKTSEARACAADIRARK